MIARASAYGTGTTGGAKAGLGCAPTSHASPTMVSANTTRRRRTLTVRSVPKGIDRSAHHQDGRDERQTADRFERVFRYPYRVHPRLRGYVSIENLFDQDYEASFGYPALPLTARVGFRVTLGGD